MKTDSNSKTQLASGNVSNAFNTGTLKFEAFFKEDIEYSQLESERVRHLIIYFYLEDNTISINEPRQRNSGIMQGTFLNRQRVFNADTNNYINPYDFRVGEFSYICGRNIYLISCDPFTRDFYTKIGCEQDPDRNIDEDNFEKVILKSYIPKDFYGLNSYVLNGRVPLQKQFLENDRKVLRFNVESLGEPFVIHYYLADDSIDVCEVKTVNSGKNPFPLLMKRQKMPRVYSLNLPGIKKNEPCILYNDFVPNSEIEILNRKFRILGCDKFTQEYFLKNASITFPLYENESKNTNRKYEMIIPPHNGFGTEEDTIQNVLKLIPKPPKKDFYNIMYNTTVLKLNGVLLTDKCANEKRLFIISYYMADKSVHIYENEIKNNGFTPGKFIEKMKYRNQRGSLNRKRSIL